MTETRCDVIVVGGGPAGSYTAYKLAEMGHRVMVIEKKEKIEGKICCTGIISQECVDSFSIKDDLILRRTNNARLIAPSGQSIQLNRKDPQACIVDRARFDIALTEMAQKEGVEYVQGSRVKNIGIFRDCVKVESATVGRELDFEARAVVLAAGFGTGLTQKVGLGKVDDFVLGTQVEVEITDIDEIEVYFGKKISPGFFAWLVPISSGKALVGLLARQEPGVYLKRFMDSLKAEGKISFDKINQTFRAVSLKPLKRTYGDRVVVVGDAAGQVKPTTGGGIYYGLLCAGMAAENLHRALINNDLTAKSLASYEEEWKKKLGWELRMGYWARELFETLSDVQINRIFDIILSRGIVKKLLEDEELSFDWHGSVILRLIGHRILSKIGLKKVSLLF